VDEFKSKFNAAAAAIQGSGWAWLGKNDKGKLVIDTTKDQVRVGLRDLRAEGSRRAERIL
jgi:superoxide dismutase